MNWSKIIIYALIILALIGVLVDAGRYRMAKASAEIPKAHPKALQTASGRKAWEGT